MSWLDLHMHSQISLDGEFSPERLAEICHDSGLKVVALSDHNSVRGVERMMTACSRFGIREIPAVELDCIFREWICTCWDMGSIFRIPDTGSWKKIFCHRKRKIRPRL